MGINVTGDRDRNSAERKDWIARTLIEANYYLSSNWDEHQGHDLQWQSYAYRHYDLDLYDHPEEIDIFCMADATQLSMTKGDIWGTPKGPTWTSPNSKNKFTIFPYSLRKDGDGRSYSADPMAIFDTDPNWDDSIVKYMYVERFNVKTDEKLTNVKPWYTQASIKNSSYWQEYHRLNYCVFDLKRCTFISSLTDLRNRATEYGVTHLHGDADGNKWLRPIRLKKFKATSSQDKHNYYYAKCEENPPTILITAVGGTVTDPTTVALKIKVTEDTTSTRKTGVKDFTYSIEKDGKTFIKKNAVETAPTGIYTANLEIIDTPFTSHGDYKITVTARDNAYNVATDEHQMTLSVPQMQCVEWSGDPGLSNRVGVEHDDYEILAASENNSGMCLGAGKENNEKNWGDYTDQNAVDLLRHTFFEKSEIFSKYSYFILMTNTDSHNVQIYGFTDLGAAKTWASGSSSMRKMTFGFCQNGAEEGPSGWVNQPIPIGEVDDNCQEFPNNAGVDAIFLKGKNYDLINPSTLATPTIDSNDVVSGLAEFKDSSTSSSDLLVDYSFEVIQDYLFHTASQFKWDNYKYFFIVPDSGAGSGRQLVHVFGASTIKKLQKVSLAPFAGKTCYSFGYCDSRPGFSTGGATEAPPKPAEIQFDKVEFTSQITGEKSKRKIIRIIDEIILGNAFAVSPELVPNMSWAWKTAGKIQNAMAVTSGAFFNYLGHYIAPEGALKEPFGLDFGPFGNDLTKSIDNVETSSPAPLSFGGLEPKEDTNKRVVRYVASSRLNGAFARVNKPPAPTIPAGISAQARHSINSNYVDPQGKADNDIPFHTANEPVYINGALQRFQGGIPGASYSMGQLLKDYDVDDKKQLIPCTSSDSFYNRDLHEDFQKFDKYEWEGKWGDDKDRFQTGVEFKITIKANNDRGKSDAGISFDGLNERATNDTECWGKIWIGDKKDYEETDASAKIPANFSHQTGSYPNVYEFYNPYFSTGRIGFGNGAKSTRTFLVRIDRKPHEEELRIFTKGYIKGNRRGELSPKSFIPKAEKIFNFVEDWENSSFHQFAKNFDITIPLGQFPGGSDIEIHPSKAVLGGLRFIENALNGFFQPIVDLINDFFNVLVTSIFGFMFALMNENYRETYHSTIEFEVEENKVYESKFENEDVERHPATRYFGSMETPLAYLYTQYHFPFADLNRFKVYGQKYYPTIPFMQNELVTGNSLSNTRVYKTNRYFIANLFRLTYETNIGVIYEYLARQNDVASPSTEIDYNIKLQDRKTVRDSDKLIEKQEPCVFDLILPSDLDDIAKYVKHEGDGLGIMSCYEGSFDNLLSEPADSAKLDSTNKTKRIAVADYMDVYSLYGDKIDPNSASGTARIEEINKIIGEFSDIEGKLMAENGYDLNTWTEHCKNGFVGLGANMTPPSTNSLIGYIQGVSGATAKTPPTYSVTIGGTTLTGTVKKDAPDQNPKTWDWHSLTSIEVAQTTFPSFNETTYTIVTAPSYTRDGIQYDYNTPEPGWNVNMAASPAAPKNLVYKIIEFILWYVQPNGIAQTTRLSASALYEYEKLMQADINAYDPTGSIDPNAKEPIIINGELYERRC